MKNLTKLIICLLIPINTWAILDIQPTSNVPFIISDDNLYSVDNQTEDLTQIGINSFSDIKYLSFHSNGSLWGWSDKGLLKIDIQTGNRELVLSAVIPLAGMAWKDDKLYGAIGSSLWSYDGKDVKQVCDLSQYTNYLEIISKDTILIENNGVKILQDFDTIDISKCKLQTVSKSNISLEQKSKIITIVKGTSRKIAFAVNLYNHDKIDYKISFTQDKTPKSGIKIISDYPNGGWSIKGRGLSKVSNTFMVNQVIYGLEKGKYTIVNTISARDTGESHSKQLIVRIVEPDPTDELSISPPSMRPSTTNLDIPTIEVRFATRVFTKSPPQLLTLEEVDENDSVIKTLGQLNDAGINGDYTVGDYVYSGIFNITSDTEGKKNYRATAIFNGELVVSKVNFFTVTRFPIGPPSAASFTDEYSFISPDTGQKIYLDKLIVAFVEGTSPERIEEIAVTENATVIGSNQILGSFHLQINSDKTLELLNKIIASFNNYPEIKYIDIAVQPTF